MAGPDRLRLAQRDATALPPRGIATTSPLADLDVQLMLRLGIGDQQAATTLIRRNAPLVSRYIARLVHDPRSVEDLTQDVFVQVLDTAHQYAPTARFSTWLYRVATNVALNHLKQAYVKRRRNLAGRDGAEPVDRAAAHPDDRLCLDELRCCVAAAISALPARQRIALLLLEYEELSYEQIASVLRVSVESVRCLLRRARTALRARLDSLR